MSNWFISDTHFHHLNCYLSYEPEREREIAAAKGVNPRTEDELDEAFFDEKEREKTLKEFDELMIERWNSVVNKDDDVWFLGDFALMNREKTAAIARRLHGKKHIVMGNHDNFSEDFYRNECGFVEASRRPILFLNQFILSHKPLLIQSDEKVFFNIYGHIHNSFNLPTVGNRELCVCACRHNYTPIKLEDYFEFDTEINIWVWKKGIKD